jgi:hypothetical protein
MEKRSRRHVRDLVVRPAFLGLSENEIGRARISMMARNTNVPFKGRIQKRKTNFLQISLSACNARAGPYSRGTSGRANAEAAFFVAEGPPLPMNSLGERRRRVLGKSGIDLG